MPAVCGSCAGAVRGHPRPHRAAAPPAGERVTTDPDASTAAYRNQDARREGCAGRASVAWAGTTRPVYRRETGDNGPVRRYGTHRDSPGTSPHADAGAQHAAGSADGVLHPARRERRGVVCAARAGVPAAVRLHAGESLRRPVAPRRARSRPALRVRPTSCPTGLPSGPSEGRHSCAGGGVPSGVTHPWRRAVTGCRATHVKSISAGGQRSASACGVAASASAMASARRFQLAISDPSRRRPVAVSR